MHNQVSQLRVVSDGSSARHAVKFLGELGNQSGILGGFVDRKINLCPSLVIVLRL